MTQMTAGQIIDELMLIGDMKSKQAASSMIILAAHAPKLLETEAEISDEDWQRLRGPSRSLALVSLLALMTSALQ